ncbi:hypothetical protein OIU85_013297, partial [Salix viminalis]
MANFVLRLPATSFRSFSISASSNGAVPGTSSSTQNGGPVILELPLDKIRRPLMRTRANDQNKVKELMDSIKEFGLQVPVQEEVNIVQGVKKQADKLKSNLIDIQSVLEDAERKQVKEKAVRVWLDKLKDVCYDMDDVLDEWSYAILRWKTGDAEENIHIHQKIRCSFLGSSCFCLNQVVRRRDIALKIKEVSEKVDEIANERSRHGLQINRATDEIQRPTSTHFFDQSS